MSAQQITVQKETFLKDLESTEKEIATLRNNADQLTIKAHQLRGAVYALDLALQAIAAPVAEAPVETPVETLPLAEAIEQSNAAVEASVPAEV